METKFNAWDIRNKKMVYDALILTETQQLVTVHKEYFNSPFSFFDGCIWLPYTGIEDFYLHDICLYTDDAGNAQIGVIEYAPGKYYLKAVNGDEEGNQDIDLHPDYPITKIGDIYTRPDLLVKK